MDPTSTRTSVSRPVRDGSPDGSAGPADGVDACPVCSARLPSSRARYCSAVCRQRAFRFRQGAPTSLTSPAPDPLRDQLRRLGTLMDHTVYQCSGCDQRFLGQQRCDDCNRFCRALGLGGACTACDEPMLIAELLGLEVTS